MDGSIEQVASGEPVTWQHTFTHPKHGELVARIADMPTYGDWLRHSNMTDTLIREFGGNPNAAGGGTHMMAAAVAGFRVLFEPITIDEQRVEVDGEAGHERIEKTFYDPLNDKNESVALEVWLRFWAWREELLKRIPDVEKGSGETTGSESGGSSLAGMVSPSMTLA
jgi:hypothetical protein